MATNSTSNWQVWKPEIDAYIDEERDNLPPSFYREVFAVDTTNRLQVNEVNDSGYSPMQEVGELGDSVEDSGLEGYGFAYQRRVYRKHTNFSSDLMETDQTGRIKQKAKEYARVIEYSRNLHAFSILRRGFDSTLVGGDSVSLFNLSHPRKDGAGTQPNTFRDGVQRGLTYDNVLELQDVLISLVSNSGNLLDIASQDKNMILWTSPFQREKAFQIAGVSADSRKAYEAAVKKPGTDENDRNYFIHGANFDVVLLPWIQYEAAVQAGETSVAKTSTSNFYDRMWGLMDQEVCKRTLKLFIAEGYEKYDEEIVKSNQVLRKYAYDKYAFGWSNYIGIAASKGDGTTVT